MLNINFDKYTNLQNSPLYQEVKSRYDMLDQFKIEMQNMIPPYDTYYVDQAQDLLQQVTQSSVDFIVNSTSGVVNAVNCVVSTLGYNQFDYYSNIQKSVNYIISATHLTDVLNKLDELANLEGFWNDVNDILKRVVIPNMSGILTKVKKLSDTINKVNGLIEQVTDYISIVASIARCFPGKLSKQVDYTENYINNMTYYIDRNMGEIMDTISTKFDNNNPVNILHEAKDVIDRKLNLQNEINKATQVIQSTMQEL